MRTRTLLYHDVVADGQWGDSGFSGGDAEIYKLTREAFVSHLAELQAAGLQASLAGEISTDRQFLITFDDGGASAASAIAPALEQLGWRGYFFMTTGWMGAPGFLDAGHLRELVQRGHVVGSHSESHPLRMSSCSRAQLLREWSVSGDKLADVLGHRPQTASIPGGAFSPLVAETAGETGIRVLFTSEPTAQVWRVGDVTCFGRYTIWRGMGPASARGLASGSGLEPVKQRLSWESKKVAKTILGPLYQRMRQQMLSSRQAP